MAIVLQKCLEIIYFCKIVQKVYKNKKNLEVGAE
jgi:hypothetical protein